MVEKPSFLSAPAPYKAKCGDKELTITEADRLPYSVESLDLSRFGTNAASLRSLLEIMEEWVHNPLIEDDFPTHAERRAWEDTLKDIFPDDIQKDIRTFLDNRNKLGTNQAASVVMCLELLPRMVETSDPTLTSHLRGLTVSLAEIVDEINRVKYLGVSGKPTYRSLIMSLDGLARDSLRAFFPSS